jgi:hypothetical protein
MSLTYHNPAITEKRFVAGVRCGVTGDALPQITDGLAEDLASPYLRRLCGRFWGKQGYCGRPRRQTAGRFADRADLLRTREGAETGGKQEGGRQAAKGDAREWIPEEKQRMPRRIGRAIRFTAPIIPCLVLCLVLCLAGMGGAGGGGCARRPTAEDTESGKSGTSGKKIPFTDEEKTVLYDKVKAVQQSELSPAEKETRTQALFSEAFATIKSRRYPGR